MGERTMNAASDPLSLREVIAMSHLSTAQILAKVGCSRRSLSVWKSGQRPSDYFIGRLNEVLGVDLWPIYRNQDHSTEITQLSNQILAPALPNTMALWGIQEGYSANHIDAAMMIFASDQLANLWRQFHTSTEMESITTLRVAVANHRTMLADLGRWNLNESDRQWLLRQLCDAQILLGRIVRDQLNFEDAITLHKSALDIARQGQSADHTVAACMRLAETLFDAGYIQESKAYCEAGISFGTKRSGRRVFGELLGLAGSVYATIGDTSESERLVHLAEELAVGAATQPTAGGIRFSETAASAYLMGEALRRGDSRTALKHITHSINRLHEEFPNSENVRWEAHIHINQAKAYTAAREEEAACGSLRSAIQLARTVNSRIGLRKIQEAALDLTRIHPRKSPMVQSLCDELQSNPRVRLAL